MDIALRVLRELLSAADVIGEDEAARQHAAEIYVQETEELCTVLARHLRDEEDLIIPLLLERQRTHPGGYFSG